MARGRPRKYNKKTLAEAVESYFLGISRTTEALDDKGRVLLNDDGKRIKIMQYLRPPTVSALCLHLGIDRSTWNNYCDSALHPEFSATVANAKLRMEAYLEEELLTRTKGQSGVIFQLQNNYGWKQKVETELGEKTRQTVSETQSMSMREKLNLIAAESALMATMAGDASSTTAVGSSIGGDAE